MGSDSKSGGFFVVIAGTLWNLSSHDSVKMEIVDHALHALADEVIVPHSGWERGSNGADESCKPRHLEWETALTNTAGCLRYWTLLANKWKEKNVNGVDGNIYFEKLTCNYASVFNLLSDRNVSSERSEARRKLRECTGLVDALMYIVQSQINRKDVDNKVLKCRALFQTNTFIPFFFLSMHLVNVLFFFLARGEQCLPPEESVLPCSPWSPWLWTLCGKRTH